MVFHLRQLIGLCLSICMIFPGFTRLPQDTLLRTNSVNSPRKGLIKNDINNAYLPIIRTSHVLISAISAGGIHTCALTQAGGVICWGSNGAGVLGDGTTINRLTPVAVSGLSSGVRAVSAGESHTCALTIGGGVKCWGLGEYGKLGYGGTDNQAIPIDVVGLSTGVVSIDAGGYQTCALT